LTAVRDLNLLNDLGAPERKESTILVPGQGRVAI